MDSVAAVLLWDHLITSVGLQQRVMQQHREPLALLQKGMFTCIVVAAPVLCDRHVQNCVTSMIRPDTC